MTTAFVRAVLLLAGLAACGHGASSRTAAPDATARDASPPATRTLALEHELPFIATDGLVVIPVQLDGIERTLYFALDTGAPTIVSESIAEELEISGRMMHGRDAAGRKIAAIPVVLPGVRVAGLHVPEVAAVIANLPDSRWLCHPIDGILGVGLELGTGFLDRVAVQVDYAHERVAFARSGIELAEGGVRLPLRRIHPDDNGNDVPTTSSEVQVVIEGQSGWVTLDTGNNGDTSMPAGLFERLGRSLDEPDLVRERGLLDISASGANIGIQHMGRLRSFDLGSLHLDDIPIEITPQTSSKFETFLLGRAFLQHFTVIVDHPAGEVRLIARTDGKPSHVGKSLGFGWRDMGDRVAVVALVDGGAADRAGLLLGDEVREIDGVTLVPGDRAQQCALGEQLGRRSGDPVAVRLRRNDRDIDVRLTATAVLPPP